MRYFQPYVNYFWQWEDNYSVAAIPNGSTIVYTQYLFSNILPHFEDTGFPRLTALMLSLIALNSNGRNHIAQSIELVSKDLIKRKLYTSANENVISTAQNFLNKLADLPDEYKTQKVIPLVLLTLLHKSHRRLTKKESKSSIRSYILQKENFFQNILKVEVNEHVLHEDLRNLQLLDSRYPSTNHIITALNGVELDPIEYEDLSQVVDTDRDYIDELIANEKTFKIGSLVRRIWSGLNLPFQFQTPSEQPLGGVSDISNKGNFDKLLLSEFANEDEVFLSRIVNQEALYYLRETPPQNNDKTRYILLDVTLKNWGIPKTIGYALAIAIAQHPKSKVKTKIFIIGNHVRECIYDNLNLLSESVEWLSPHLHASEGLDSFFQYEELSSNKEIFLISSNEAIQDSDWQLGMNLYFDQINYWVVPDREGEITVSKREYRSKKQIQKFKLPLDDLWKRDTPIRIYKQVSNQFKLDTITSILFPYPKRVIYSAQLENILYLIDKHQSLYRVVREAGSHYSKKAAYLIYDKLPKGISEKTVIFEASHGSVIVFTITSLSKIFYIDTFNHKSYESEFPDVKFGAVHSLFNIGNKIVFSKGSRQFEVFLDYGGELKIQDATPVSMEKKESMHYLPGTSVLSDIKRVYINKENGLCVNKHQLIFNKKENTIYWQKANHLESVQKVSATWKHNAYVFPNDVSVFIDKRGMLQLESTSGHLKFYALKLNHSGSNRIELIKYLEAIDPQSLKERKMQIDLPGSVIFKSESREEVEKTKLQVKDNFKDVQLEIVEMDAGEKIYIPMVLDANIALVCGTSFTGNEFYYPDNRDLMVMNVVDFYNQFIQSLILKIGS